MIDFKMGDIEQEVIAEQESIRLPLPLVLKIAKYFEGEEHSLSLAISGAMDGYATLYATDRQSHGLFISGKCHFLTPSLWGDYFTQYIYPEGITNFSASTCYWLPAQQLFENIAKMVNLKELGIDDTKLSLIHLLRIFQKCHKILKLSFTLREATLDSYQENSLGKALFETLCQGFRRLTHLKLFTTNPGSKTYDSWPVTLNVLSWCNDCVDLLIEVDHLSLSVWDERTRCWTKSESGGSACNKKVLQLVRDKFLPHLGWFKALKSLVIVLRGNDYLADNPPFTVELIDWLFIRRELFPYSIERLWITDESQDSPYLLANSKLPTSQMKSLFLWDLQHDVSFSLDDQRLNEIEHLAGLSFPNQLKVKKTKLKFAHGHFVDHYGLKKFCDDHPQLEYLYIDTEIFDGQINRSISVEPLNGLDHKIGDADWKLLKLKILGYKSASVDKETLDQLIMNCPNIEELHLFSLMWDAADLRPENYNPSIFSKIRSPNLKKLSLVSICLCDGDVLIPIMEHCPKLRSLNIDFGDASLCTQSVFLGNLGKSLSFAKNLCDLRLTLEEETQADVFRFLNDVLSSCPLLERFVFDCSIHTIERGEPTNWKNPDELEEYLLKFVTKLKKLTVLSLDGFLICSEITRAIGDRLVNEILPLRPSFWFFLGVNLYNKTNIPRVLRNEIIFPRFYATPKF